MKTINCSDCDSHLCYCLPGSVWQHRSRRLGEARLLRGGGKVVGREGHWEGAVDYMYHHDDSAYTGQEVEPAGNCWAWDNGWIQETQWRSWEVSADRDSENRERERKRELTT